ncbi:hypothetical protein TraAM80_03446 [Trypanosoma rangeli]|uniref:Uncharacterized protein n=1 Tax=Trypanosoma rangeli TaxID=5698 RepID=A0A422NPE8_TRYRA|nr:uncharacterized protein TraAM80_03446 [Trypanosoma rangeli]RNF07311.1 hypothetical protein TraAM80_03446 [Trypanosoma rangeli]|eukprot:RNF07311.1 hypothetical protein TraAM80_03446 [Trypanosoma rangeli]
MGHEAVQTVIVRLTCIKTHVHTQLQMLEVLLKGGGAWRYGRKEASLQRPVSDQGSLWLKRQDTARSPAFSAVPHLLSFLLHRILAILPRTLATHAVNCIRTREDAWEDL